MTKWQTELGMRITKQTFPRCESIVSPAKCCSYEQGLFLAGLFGKFPFLNSSRFKFKKPSDISSHSKTCAALQSGLSQVPLGELARRLPLRALRGWSLGEHFMNETTCLFLSIDHTPSHTIMFVSEKEPLWSLVSLSCLMHTHSSVPGLCHVEKRLGKRPLTKLGSQLCKSFEIHVHLNMDNVYA